MAKRPIMCSRPAVYVPDEDCSECMIEVSKLRNEMEACCDEVKGTLSEHDGRITTNANGITALGNDITDLENTKQDKIEAGDNIVIDGNVISAEKEVYTAGTNIDIDGNNVISTPSYTGTGNVSVNNNKEISVDLSDYYTSDKVYTKDEVNALMQNGFEFVPVDTLPTTGSTSKVYLLATADPDVRDMYVYNENQWKKVGSTGVKLDGYVKTTGAKETYDEHRVTVWYGDEARRLTILGIGWDNLNTITSNDGYNSGSIGADTGGDVTP